MFSLKRELKEKAEKNVSIFYKILKKCLGAKKEDILIITDYGYEGKELAPLFGYGYYHAAKSKGLQVELLFQEIKKGFMHAEGHVIKALKNLEKGSIIIITVSNKLGRIGEQKSFRKFCKEKEHRFVSTTGLSDAKTNHFDLFLEAMDVNYNRIKRRSLWLKKRLDKAKEVRIKTAAGTDITFDVSGMTAVANNGNYKEKGSGGNIPAGEVYIPPKGFYGVNGVFVIDGSMKTTHGTLLIDEPVIVHVKEGRVVKLEGKYAPLLERTFLEYENRVKYPCRIRHIGELGIGINDGAVLIGSTLMDEKVRGTAHIAIGSNYWFGGEIRTVFHGDQILKNPIIYLDGEMLDW